jgi:biopolymer transport protein ExbD
MIFPRKRRRSPGLNIIPLIDVLVVLLIFYIATTVFKKPQPTINIVVPSTTHAKATQETPPSIIYVTSDSKMFLDDVPVDPAELTDQLKAKLAANANFKVAMKADTTAPFGIITKVMESAHDAGISNLQTFTQQEKSEGDSGK